VLDKPLCFLKDQYMSDNENLRIGLAQINTTVGDLSGNYRKIIQGMEQAKSADCDLIAFPELCIPGYPPEDLLQRKQFVLDQRNVLQEILSSVEGIVCVVGFVDSEADKLYNAAAVLQNKAIKATYRKTHLPNYSVFDEARYFTKGNEPLVVTLDGVSIGISICEDIWIPNSVVESEAFCAQAELLLNISASPFFAGKGKDREELMRSRAENTHTIVAYLNLVGGQDELVFDGHSVVISAADGILATGNSFAEDFIVVDLNIEGIRQFRAANETYERNSRNFRNPFSSIETVALAPQSCLPKASISRVTAATAMGEEAEIYNALVLGLRDYVQKNKFDKVTFGLSGGIDSALVAALAADAIGKDRVVAVSMPSHYSSRGSVDDAKRLAQNLGIKLLHLPIKSIFDSYLDALKPTFTGLLADIAEENLQARVRGALLMALSNKFGWLVLATGNKSEVSVGYCTIYGDTVGGFAPLKDVLKTMVYKLCAYRNKLAGYDLVPKQIIEKPPSAELKPNQTDQDTLPPYDKLDSILELYIEQEMGVEEVVVQGFDVETVRRVARMVDMSEYKRRQAAPGPKITPRAFGKDRRMPITNHYLAR